VGIAVLAATEFEVALLKAAGYPTLVAGMGAVNTAHALGRHLVTQERPSLVLQVGIAGAYVPTGIAVESVLMASSEMFGDVGVLTPEGWLPAEAIGIPLVPETASHPALFNEYPCEAALVARAKSIAGSAIAHTGRFLTLAQCTGVRTLGDALHARFNVICESMEGAAAAQVCAIHDIPFLEVRGVSNLVEDRARETWRIREAAESAQAAVRRLLEGARRLI